MCRLARILAWRSQRVEEPDTTKSHRSTVSGIAVPGHSGSVASLEEWLDPARLGSDYVPSGFKGADGGPRLFPGHLFGLSLSNEDRRALVAYLKTL